MRKINKIHSAIDKAQSAINILENQHDVNDLRQDDLKNSLEKIRREISSLMNNASQTRVCIKVCKIFLEELLEISERLRMTYVCPTWDTSFDIFDTLKLAERKISCYNH